MKPLRIPLEKAQAGMKLARALKDEEFKAERPELEKMAGEIVGNLSPLDVLRHVLAQDLAELLSNPRLVAAIDARLKK